MPDVLKKFHVLSKTKSKAERPNSNPEAQNILWGYPKDFEGTALAIGIRGVFVLLNA